MNLQNIAEQFTKTPAGIRENSRVDATEVVASTLFSTLTNSGFDIANLIDVIGDDPVMWAKAFGNKDEAKRFGDYKDAMRNRFPDVGVTDKTQQVQDDILNPIVDAISSGWNSFSATNPNASQSITEYGSDPRVQHTLESSILAAPVFSRLANAFKGANFKKNLQGGGGGKQKGIVDLYGNPTSSGNPIDYKTMIASAFVGDGPTRREFYPNPDNRQFKSMHRPNSKEYGYDMGYRDKLGGTTAQTDGTRLNTPLHELSRVISDTGNPLPNKEFDVNQLRGQSVIPFFGDQSQAATNLWGINDHMFDEPVRLTGGYEWWREHPDNIWAGDQNATKSLMGQIDEAHGMDQDMFGIYAPMSIRSSNFNDMTLGAIQHGIKGLDLGVETKADFDDAIRKKWNKWTSIDDPAMDSKLKTIGEARKAFVDTSGQKKFTQQGFPTLEDAIYGVSDPKLTHVPQFHGGQHVGKASGDMGIMGTGVYNRTIGGEGMGSTSKPIPPQLIWQDYSRELDMKGTTNQKNRDYSFYRSHPSQKMTNQIVDDILRYLEE